MTKNKENIYEALHKLITGILIPVIFFLLSEIETLRSDLKDFQIQVARDYAKNEVIVRIEQKLDDIRNLVIQEIKKK